MAETTYNLTIPHTSPWIRYENFKTECPETSSDGIPVCDDLNGFHVASNSSGQMRLKFVGTAIYVYGSVDQGMDYTWSLDYGSSTKGTPNGNLLLSAENLQLGRFSDYFTLEIDLAQFTAGARFQFSKADVILGTGFTGAQTIIDSYKPGNQSLRMTTGWAANDTFTGYHFVQSGGNTAQTAILDFQGIAMWIWGFCGPRGEFLGGDYGTVLVDGGYKDYITMSSEGISLYGDRWIAHRCLMYWSTGLLGNNQQHNVTYDSSSYNVLLESIEVLRVEGGTRISSSHSTSTSRPRSTTTGTGFSTSIGPSPSPSNDPKKSGSQTGAIVGGVIGGLLAIGAIVGVIFFFLRKQQRVKSTVPGQGPGQVPAYYSAAPGPAPPPQLAYNNSNSYPSPTAPYGHPGVMTATSSRPLVTSNYFPTTSVHEPSTFTPTSQTASHSTNTSPIEQPRGDRTAAEVNRLRQEMDAMMAAMYDQQRTPGGLPVDGREAPPEYLPNSPPARSGTVLSTGSWQPPSMPPPSTGHAFPQEKS